MLFGGEERDGNFVVASKADAGFSNAHVRFQSRNRSLSTDGSQRNAERNRQRQELDDFEHRRRYVATILERYYSHPSNRQRSLPSVVRDQILSALASESEEERRKMTSESVPVDDSLSEVSSAVSGYRTSGDHNSGSARATPDLPSQLANEQSSPMTPGSKNSASSKKKSRFFRSSSMRSIKKWMNKLRGKVNQNGAAERKKEGADLGSFPPPRPETVVNNGVAAATHDSGLQTPSEGSSNCNRTNLQPYGQCDAVDAVGSSKHFNKPISTTIPTTVDIPTPALCGILNHGNTCYINAVVQCLSNTDLLAEYFLSGQYWTDLKNNLRNADRYGSQGNVTLALARFFKALWFNTYTHDVSSNFKSIVERYSEQYRGNQQQDAQEFFYWLVDRVHEDLNVAVKRRYKLHKSRSKNEDELAAAAMEKHLEAHNSFISARFHGLFLSTVTCPVCHKQSMKPDPFMCISLPVSQCTKRPLFVVVIFINRQPRKVRFGLNADVTATFLEVKRCLADATDLSVDQLLLCEINDCGFQSSLADQHEVISLEHTKCIWAFEIPVPIRHFAHSSIVDRDDELILLIGNQVASSGENGLRFGSPIALRVNRESSYGDLCHLVLFALRPQFRAGVMPQDIPLSAFRIRIVDDYHPFAYLSNDISLPLYTQAVDNALLRLTGHNSSPSAPHLKLMFEWQRDASERYFSPAEERTIDHVSAQDLRDQEEHPEIQSIHDCLAEYTRPDLCQWYCPECRKRQDNATKRIVFYWLPDVLVIHLKRFKQLSGGQLVKLDSTVWFPVSDLDLSDYTHQSISRNQKRQQYRSAQQHRMQNGELYVDTRPSQNLYDLYAVCNHSGHSPHSGHYTAYCRNPVNGRWYCFDDQNVTPMRERDLVTNGAYLLFYERRQLRKGSDGHNSAESGFVDHWFFRVYSNHLTDRDKSSYSSKDTLDGNESNGGSSSGANNRVKLVTESVGDRQIPQSSMLPGQSSRCALNNEANGVMGIDYGSSHCEEFKRNIGSGDKERKEGPESISLPSHVSVVASESTTSNLLDEVSPTSNDGSTTVTAETLSPSSDGFSIRKDSHEKTRSMVNNCSLGGSTGNKSALERSHGSQRRRNDSELLDNVFASSNESTKQSPLSARAGAVRRSSTSSDAITHKFRTYSVVETDL